MCVSGGVCVCVCAKGKHVIVVPSWMVEVHEANLLTVVHTFDVKQGLCPSNFREYLRVQLAWILAKNDQKLSKIGSGWGLGPTRVGQMRDTFEKVPNKL